MFPSYPHIHPTTRLSSGSSSQWALVAQFCVAPQYEAKHILP